MTTVALEQMVMQQVRAWDVLEERVLDTLRRVPRERFVPTAFRAVAYADAAIPLPHGQHMLTPQFIGRILKAIGAAPTETVLEIGTGSGYLTACLASSSARPFDRDPRRSRCKRPRPLRGGGHRQCRGTDSRRLRALLRVALRHHCLDGLPSAIRRALPARAGGRRAPFRGRRRGTRDVGPAGAPHVPDDLDEPGPV